jgi:hypothetical protein
MVESIPSNRDGRDPHDESFRKQMDKDDALGHVSKRRAVNIPSISNY